MKKMMIALSVLLLGCTAGEDLYPEIEAAEAGETVQTEYLSFCVESAEYDAETLYTEILVTDTFPQPITVFDTDFWLYTGEGTDVLYPAEEQEIRLSAEESGTLKLAYRAPKQKEYILGYMDVREDGVTGNTYYVRIKVK
ncbi:MAG: hypothetical protein IJJ24_02460 [Solobacterium sp.]|nr:hypothetical protein [Solobacterium sp.]MBR0477938.1 hypothetical protein [Solobacterium sp.]